MKKLKAELAAVEAQRELRRRRRAAALAEKLAAGPARLGKLKYQPPPIQVRARMLTPLSVLADIGSLFEVQWENVFSAGLVAGSHAATSALFRTSLHGMPADHPYCASTQICLLLCDRSPQTNAFLPHQCRCC